MLQTWWGAGFKVYRGIVWCRDSAPIVYGLPVALIMEEYALGWQQGDRTSQCPLTRCLVTPAGGLEVGCHSRRTNEEYALLQGGVENEAELENKHHRENNVDPYLTPVCCNEQLAQKANLVRLSVMGIPEVIC